MENGYFKKIEKTIHHDAIPYQEEKSHYETVREFPNGGKEVVKVIDSPEIQARDAYDEAVYEDVWMEFTQKEKNEIRISELKRLLAESDYQAIKYAEGVISVSDYAPIKAKREMWRKEINDLEKTL